MTKMNHTCEKPTGQIQNTMLQQLSPNLVATTVQVNAAAAAAAAQSASQVNKGPDHHVNCTQNSCFQEGRAQG
jgi:hypothetical protein